MHEHVSAYMNQLHMVNPGEKILVGLSGGADSVCLFYVLLALQKSLSFSMEAVHVNHMLRETAERDELFVKQICEEEGIPLHRKHVDVTRLAKQQGLSFEEAGRNARYDFFAETMQHTGATRIAVAHHMDDRAETILFHLCRGTGVDGLGGIRPVREQVIRPLLCVDRMQIEAYLSELGKTYMTDETNADNQYSRNRIRNEVLPILEQVCSGAGRHTAETGELMTQISEYLKVQVRAAMQMCTERAETDIQIVCSSWQEQHPYIQGELIRQCIAASAGSKKDISKVHVEAVQKLAGAQVGSRCDLPYAVEVLRSYDRLIFRKKETECIADPAETFCVTVDAEALEQGTEIELPDGKIISLRLLDFDKNAGIPTKTYTKWLDYDKIDEPLMIRTPDKDDFFYFDHKNKKYVKDYMVNEKIPLQQRSRSIVVASGNHMLYFVGKRISSYVKTDDTTKKVLEIMVTGG